MLAFLENGKAEIYEVEFLRAVLKFVTGVHVRHSQRVAPPVQHLVLCDSVDHKRVVTVHWLASHGGCHGKLVWTI